MVEYKQVFQYKYNIEPQLKALPQSERNLKIKEIVDQLPISKQMFWNYRVAKPGGSPRLPIEWAVIIAEVLGCALEEIVKSKNVEPNAD